MADFCAQCSKDMGFTGFKGKDGKHYNNDFDGIITSIQFAAGFVATGICEGCAGGEFDHNGNCLGGCMNPEHGKENKNG